MNNGDNKPDDFAFPTEFDWDASEFGGDGTDEPSTDGPIKGGPITDGPIQVIGKPGAMGGAPRMRPARLSDCEDGCPICEDMREQILAGKPPMIMAFD